MTYKSKKAAKKAAKQKTYIQRTAGNPDPTPLANIGAPTDRPPNVIATCCHLEESRKDPNSDFYGYALELKPPKGHPELVVHGKMCKKCAIENESETLARIPYACLSDLTLKATIIAHNQPNSPTRMTPGTERGREIFKEVETEKRQIN